MPCGRGWRSRRSNAGCRRIWVTNRNGCASMADEDFQVEVTIRMGRLATLGLMALLAGLIGLLYVLQGGISVATLFFLATIPVFIVVLIAGPKSLIVTNEYAIVMTRGREES